MVIRTTAGMLALAAALWAQPSAPYGRGPGGRGPNGAGPRLIGAEAGMPGRVVRNAPYSAEIVTETTQTLPDGNHIKRTSTTKVYRDSEGRTRREQSLSNLGGLGVASGNSGQPQVAFINDPVAGVNYALDLANRTVTKSSWRGRGQGGPGGQGPRMVRSNGEVSPLQVMPMPPFGGRARNRQNVRTESLGKQNIEGVQAEGTRTTLTIAAGEIGNEQPIQVVDETWYSPELQTVVLRRHSDPRSGETVTRHMSISRTEPSRMLFEPPADFKVTESGRGRTKE